MADDDTLNQSIDELRASLEQERAARLEAEQGRRTAENQARRHASEAGAAGNEVQRTRMQTLESSIDQIKTQRDVLRGRLREASAEGDHDAVADITVEMSDIGARLLSLENGKAHLQQQIDNPPRPQGPVQDTRPFNSLTSAERVDRIASGLSERSAAWVRRHPEWALTESNVAALVGAHNATLGRGRVPDTPEYFADIERILGVNDGRSNGYDQGGDSGGDSRSGAAHPTRDTPPPAAPARSGDSGRLRTLTPREREAAQIAGQTDEEYAKAQDALLKEGRIVRH